MNRYLDLLTGFARIGVLGFGGGMACLVLIEREAVTKYEWLNQDEFSEIVAISNTLPGPINTKMAGYIGYRVAGVIGATIAILATILPSIFMLIGLLGGLAFFNENPIVAGMTNAIMPVVGVMLALMSWQFLTVAAKNMRKIYVLIHVLIVGVLVVFLNIHPAIVIATLIGIAIFKPVKGGDGS